MLLGLPATASFDEVKRAFRREIARYHPDKVQHLGREFQEMAAHKAAELTQAYTTLGDAALRAAYDLEISNGVATPRAPAAPSAPPPPVARQTPPPPPRPEPAPRAAPAASGGASIFAHDRAGAGALLRRATIERFRAAISATLSSYDEATLPGFDVACIPKPSFWNRKPQPRVFARVVPTVDASALIETWAMAGKAGKAAKEGQRDLCVFLMGPAVAPAGELAAAIGEQRRRAAFPGGNLVMVPVNSHTWLAHVPTDAPQVVKSLVVALKGP